MPTYVYQTIPTEPGRAPRRFEMRQAISEAPLLTDPETGDPVERVITGGRGPLVAPTGGTEPTVTGGCGPSCGCH